MLCEAAVADDHPLVERLRADGSLLALIQVDADRAGRWQGLDELRAELERETQVSISDAALEELARRTLRKRSDRGASGTDPDSLRFERDGDEIVFTGALDFTEQSSDMNSDSDDGSDLTVSITFPGTVIDHNGELSGTTVSWSTPLKARVEMSARSEAGGAVAAGNLLPLILGIAGVVVMVSSQPIAIVLIALAVGIGFWGRAKLKQAEPHVR